MKKLLFTAIGLVALTACSVRSDHSQKQAGQYAEPDSVITVDSVIAINPEDTVSWLEEEVIDVPEIPEEASSEVDEKAMEDYERMFQGKE